MIATCYFIYITSNYWYICEFLKIKESIKSLDILLFSCPCCEVLVSAISELPIWILSWQQFPQVSEDLQQPYAFRVFCHVVHTSKLNYLSSEFFAKYFNYILLFYPISLNRGNRNIWLIRLSAVTHKKLTVCRVCVISYNH